METRKIKALLDTNVLLDLLSSADRPSSEASRMIFQAIRSGFLEGVLTTQSILDANYILSRCENFSFEAFGQCILSLRNFVNIGYLDLFDIQDAIRHPGGDFEDGAHFAHAEAEGCDVLVTSDRQLLKRESSSGMLVLTPAQLIARMSGQ